MQYLPKCIQLTRAAATVSNTVLEWCYAALGAEAPLEGEAADAEEAAGNGDGVAAGKTDPHVKDEMADGVLADPIVDLGSAKTTFTEALSDVKNNWDALKRDLQADTAGADAAASCVNSFTADTLVLMANGKEEPIADVRIGDKVLATDPETGRTQAESVEALIRHSGHHSMVLVTLANGSLLDATSGHRIWDATRDAFVDAGELKIGDNLETGAGALMAVIGLTVYSADLTAYNLQVEQIHTYYAGATPVLVHNACNPMTINQMNQAIRRGQAPRGIERIDPGRVKGEQTHAAFGKGQGAPSLNIDGTWKHGFIDLTRVQKDWLRMNGWDLND